VWHNLLSLQSTAELLATAQSRLATGKKVNTALDNPTNFFTAQSVGICPSRARLTPSAALKLTSSLGVPATHAANTWLITTLFTYPY